MGRAILNPNRRVTFDLLAGPRGPGGPRLGRLTIGGLDIPTPAFMPVGTRAGVKTLGGEDLEAIGARLILANTYHLLLRPGPERIALLGGLHRFMSWRGGILTDSGGYQVFSLADLRRIRDDGIEFRSHLDGTRHFLTPESVLEIQGALGSDIRMVLDVCTPYPAEPGQTRAEMEQTLRWAERSRSFWEGRPGAERAGAAVFGIVQGGVDPALREECARRLVAVGFDGYALGGFSVGEPACERPAALDAGIGPLPADRPRYLMGVGSPLEILDAVDRGVDLFDCVLPTRNARKGTVFAWQGRMVVKNRVYAEDERPIDPECRCAACRRYSRAYLRHLFLVGVQLAGRLATIHSLAFYQELMARARAAIGAGAWGPFLAEMRARWSEEPGPEAPENAKEEAE
jgi:queuine tRNA-ribosyltransferase